MRCHVHDPRPRRSDDRDRLREAGESEMTDETKPPPGFSEPEFAWEHRGKAVYRCNRKAAFGSHEKDDMARKAAIAEAWRMHHEEHGES